MREVFIIYMAREGFRLAIGEKKIRLKRVKLDFCTFYTLTAQKRQFHLKFSFFFDFLGEAVAILGNSELIFWLWQFLESTNLRTKFEENR